MREYEERIRLRELKRAAREAGHRCAAAKRARESEERVRFRKLRTQPCGAKTRAGHPCQREGLGRGGRCPNHGGASTRPRKNELKRYALGTKNKSLRYNDDGANHLSREQVAWQREGIQLAPGTGWELFYLDPCLLARQGHPRRHLEATGHRGREVTSGRRCRLLRVVLQMRLTIAFELSAAASGYVLSWPATALGLENPPKLLFAADEVIGSDVC